MHRKETGRPTTDHIHNEMDEPLPNKKKKNALIVGMKSTIEQIVHIDNSRM